MLGIVAGNCFGKQFQVNYQLTKRKENLPSGKNSLGERLDEALAVAQKRASWLAREADVTPAYISRLKKGDKSNPSPEVLTRIAQALGISVDWLLTGEGEMMSADAPPSVQEPARSYEAKPVRWVPILPWDQSPESMEEIRERIVNFALGKVPVETEDQDAFGMRVRGDAMEPKFAAGCVVILSPGTPLWNECLCVAKPPTAAPIFRRCLFIGEDRFRLMAYNPAYPTTEHSSEDFEWIHPVTWVTIDARN